MELVVKLFILLSGILLLFSACSHAKPLPAGLLGGGKGGEGGSGALLDVGGLLGGLLGGGKKPSCSTKNYGTVAGVVNEVLELVGLGCPVPGRDSDGHVSAGQPVVPMTVVGAGGVALAVPLPFDVDAAAELIAATLIS